MKNNRKEEINKKRLQIHLSYVKKQTVRNNKPQIQDEEKATNTQDEEKATNTNERSPKNNDDKQGKK